MNLTRTVLLGLSVLLLALGLLYFGMRGSPRPVDALSAQATWKDSAAASSGQTVSPLPKTTTHGRALASSEVNGTPAPEEMPALEIVVREPSLAPLAGALIVLYRGEEGLAEATTAQDGVARLSAPGGVGKYALFAPGWDTTLGDLDLSAGRRVLQLVEGATIAGRVIVDGGPPDEHFQLFFGTSASMPQLSRLMPQAARKLVFKTRDRLSGLMPIFASDGSFVLRGLPRDVRGMFLWSPPYFIEGRGDGFDATHFNVPLPRGDLELRLISGIMLKLRVVDDAARPVAFAHTIMWLGAAIGGDHPTQEGNANGEGRMSVSLSRKSLAPVRLAIGKSNLTTPKIFEFAPPTSLSTVWDLGDLAVPSTRKITVHVKDPMGEPVENAIVSSWFERSSQAGGRQAPKGLTTLEVSIEGGEVAARAFGYEGARQTVPFDATEVTVTLARACVLEFATAETLASREGLTLELSGPTPLFVDEALDSAPAERSRSSQSKLYSSGSTSLFRMIGWTDLRDWRVGALTPGQELRVKLLANGRELCNQTIAPLAPAEQRRVTLAVGSQAHTLRLRVLAPNGNRLSAARISLATAHDASRIQSTQTDGLGNATLQVFEERCKFYVQAEGFAPRWVVVDPIPSDALEIALEAQRTVDVELVGEDGAPYLGSAKVYWPSPMGGLREAQSIGPARFRLDGLPAKEIVLLATLDTGQVSAVHDASIPFARIVVGAKGIVSVRMPVAQTSSSGEWFAALAPTGSGRDCMRVELKSNVEEPGLGAAFLGVRAGSYDVWLEQASPSDPDEYRRVGRSITLTIDAEHTLQSAELTIPD